MFKKIITEGLSWLLLLIKLLLALLLIALAKVTLRTNPILAMTVLGVAAVFFLLWYFAPQLKHYFDR